VLGPESVERLLDGIAEALAEEVLPHVQDELAQMQLKAAAELLRNLAARVEWHPRELEAECARLEELASLLGAEPEAPAEGLAERHEALLARVAAALRRLEEDPGGDAAARAEVHRRLRAGAEAEVARLRRGMYR
jgi:hypothetical protein